MAPSLQTFKQSSGAKLGYRVHGDDTSRPPLVLIMGMSGIMEDWSPFVEAVAHSRRVLVFDHVGIGASYAPEDWDYDLSVASMAKDCLDLVASLGWKSVDILGWSMGGHILQTMITLPEAKENTSKGGLDIKGVHVRKVILAGTMTKLPRGDFKPNELEAAAAKVPKAERKKFMTQTLLELQYFPEWLQASQDNRNLVAERVKDSIASRRPQEIIGLQIGAIMAHDVRPDLHKVPKSLPVLVIHGARDRMVYYQESEPIMEGIKHATRLQTPTDQIGHFWFDFLPGKFWRDSLDEFLDGDASSQRSAKL